MESQGALEQGPLLDSQFWVTLCLEEKFDLEDKNGLDIFPSKSIIVCTANLAPVVCVIAVC